MAGKKRIKKYTLSEFKAWLDGIEEIQPATWSPDATQWKMIRDKINGIVEEVIEVEVPVPAPQVAPAPQIPQGPIPRNAAPAVDNGWTPPAAPAFAPSEPTLTSAAKAALAGNTLPPELMPDASGKVKTPDINTSDGNFTSSFG